MRNISAAVAFIGLLVTVVGAVLVVFGLIFDSGPLVSGPMVAALLLMLPGVSVTVAGALCAFIDWGDR